MRKIKIGDYYKHFKGNTYQITDIVNDCESQGDNYKKIVIYEAQYGEHLRWARKYEDFISLVDKTKYPEVKQKYRFEKIDA